MYWVEIDLADEYALVAAEQRRDDEFAQHRHRGQQHRRGDARPRQRQRDVQEGLPARRPEIAAGLGQRRRDARQHDKERHDRDRQVGVDQADEDGCLRVEHVERTGVDVERVHHRFDRPAARQQYLPRHHADEEAGEVGHQNDDERRRPEAAGVAGDEVGGREGGEDAERRAGDGEADRAQERVQVEAGERRLVVVEREAERHAAEGRAPEREDHREAERRDEEEKQPECRHRCQHVVAGPPRAAASRQSAAGGWLTAGRIAEEDCRQGA